MTYRAMSIGFGLAMVSSVFLALAKSAELDINTNVAAWAPFMIGMATWAIVAAQHVRS